jgi:hypothetical protein
MRGLLQGGNDFKIISKSSLFFLAYLHHALSRLNIPERA